MEIKDNQIDTFSKKDKFDISLETRNFEIELFWKRSLFFWGFIASDFVAFAALYEKNSKYTILISGLGFICSLIWTLANRGSKFWQENWETKVAKLEDEIGENLFNYIEKPQDYKFLLLRARKYSVSKLAISLSDYILLIWLGIFLTVFNKQVHLFPNIISTKVLIWIFTGFTVAYTIYIFKYTRTSAPNKRKE